MAAYVWIVTGFVFLGSGALRGIAGQDAEGMYTHWGSWSECTVTCGNRGIQYHVRFCDERPPHGSGQNCSVNETDVETRHCSKRLCPKPKTACDYGLDLALIIDKSSSIGKKALTTLYQSFLPEYLQKLTISSQATHVGIVLYSPFAELVNLFRDQKYQDKQNLITMVKNLPPASQWGTRVDKALEMASSKLYTTDGGDRSNRKNVLVLIGDGRTRPSVNLKLGDKVSDLRTKGTDIIALGYGDGRRPLNMTQLREIANEKVYNLKESPSIQEAAEKVDNLTCALDGGYTIWGVWSVCSATCGRGMRVRVRTCSYPPPAKSGKSCAHLGTNRNIQPCNEGNCPKAPPHCERKKIDVCLIIDRSSSVTRENVVRVKTFLIQLVSAFEVSPTATNFGIILFSASPYLFSKLGDQRYHSKDGIIGLIQGIPDRVFSGTRTDRALRMASERMFTPEAGDRPDATNVVIVMTDGKTRRGSEPFDVVVPLLTEEKGAKVIAFGVGSKIDDAELRQIGGENVFHGTDFKHLYEAINALVGMTCEVA